MTWGGNRGYRPPSWGTPKARQEIGVLVGLALISIVLWGSPLGRYALYPFSILATWFHEMGHGLAAMAFGYSFDRLVIFPNASGYALYFAEQQPGRVSQAIIAACGLLGPTAAGCLLIIASRTRKATKSALVFLGIALVTSTVIWVRSMTGWLILPALGIACFALVRFAAERHRRFAVQFLGVQGCISIYTDLGYLFSEGGVLGGQAQLSDTKQIEQALILPYWFWGGAITALIVMMIWQALKYAHR